jgi:hypothetical protein
MPPDATEYYAAEQYIVYVFQWMFASGPLQNRSVPPNSTLNVVRRLYHSGRSVSDLARACRLMGEGAYDRLHARRCRCIR